MEIAKRHIEQLCWYINPQMKKAAEEQEKATVTNPNFARQIAEMNDVQGDIEIG